MDKPAMVASLRRVWMAGFERVSGGREVANIAEQHCECGKQATRWEIVALSRPDLLMRPMCFRCSRAPMDQGTLLAEYADSGENPLKAMTWAKVAREREPDWLTIPEYAAQLGVAVVTVRGWIKRDRLEPPARRDNGRWLMPALAVPMVGRGRPRGIKPTV